MQYGPTVVIPVVMEGRHWLGGNTTISCLLADDAPMINPPQSCRPFARLTETNPFRKAEALPATTDTYEDSLGKDNSNNVNATPVKRRRKRCEYSQREKLDAIRELQLLAIQTGTEWVVFTRSAKKIIGVIFSTRNYDHLPKELEKIQKGSQNPWFIRFPQMHGRGMRKEPPRINVTGFVRWLKTMLGMNRSGLDPAHLSEI